MAAKWSQFSKPANQQIFLVVNALVQPLLPMLGNEVANQNCAWLQPSRSPGGQALCWTIRSHATLYTLTRYSHYSLTHSLARSLTLTPLRVVSCQVTSGRVVWCRIVSCCVESHLVGASRCVVSCCVVSCRNAPRRVASATIQYCFAFAAWGSSTLSCSSQTLQSHSH